MLLSNHNYNHSEPFFVILAPLEGFNMKTCLIDMLLDELEDEVAPEDRRHRVQVPVEGVQHQELEGLQRHFFSCLMGQILVVLAFLGGQLRRRE